MYKFLYRVPTNSYTKDQQNLSHLKCRTSVSDLLRIYGDKLTDFFLCFSLQQLGIPLQKFPSFEEQNLE